MAAPLTERVRRLLPVGSQDRDPDSAARIKRIENRLVHLEAALEGLQDAVHRQSIHQDEEITALRHRTEPGELARTISDDARRRGI